MFTAQPSQLPFQFSGAAIPMQRKMKRTPTIQIPKLAIYNDATQPRKLVRDAISQPNSAMHNASRQGSDTESRGYQRSTAC